MTTHRRSPDDLQGNARFPTTHWSLVLSAGQGSRAALASLYQDYWYPLYAFGRRSGIQPEEVQDLLQGFFLRTMEKGDLAPSEAGRGRFRSWLLGAFKNFLMNRRARPEGA